MKRLLVYRPVAQRELQPMDRSDVERVGKWRIFFSLDEPRNVVVIDVDNRGQAY